MRGSSSPSGSATSRRPNPVSRITMPGCSSVQTPMTAASRPSGCARSAASTRVGRVRRGRRSAPCLRWRRAADRCRPVPTTPRTAAPHRQRRLVEDDADAALRRHLVQRARHAAARRILHRRDRRRARRVSAARISPLIGATSDARSASSSRPCRVGHHRHPVVAERAGDDDPVAGPQAASRARCERSARCRWC